MLLPCLLALTLAAGGGGGDAPAGQGSEQAEVATKKKEKDYDALVIPMVNYNSDEKFGFGVVGGFYLYRPGVAPYAHAVGGQTYVTTGGAQSHFLRYDAPQFLGSSLRFEARLELRKERFAPFYGPGNVSAPELEDHPPPGARPPRYTYQRRTIGGWFRLRTRPLGALAIQTYGGYSFRDLRHRSAPGSLLFETQPRGEEGGPVGQLLLGLIHDTRDDDAAPDRGGSQEVSLKLAARATGSRYTYGEATVVVRHFFPLAPRLVFGQRVVGDLLFGDVPFFEWPLIGGLTPAEGIGGMSSVRGELRQRYGGTTKVLSNSELRVTVAEPQLFGQPTKLGAVAFFDAGRAWSREVPDGPAGNFHLGGGIGLRLVRRAAALRLDYAISQDRTAVYTTFGHLF